VSVAQIPIKETEKTMKGNFMKNRKTVTKLAFSLAILLTLDALEAQAKTAPVYVSFAPVGLTMNQTARVNLVNLGVPNGVLIRWSFIDATGLILAQSTAVLQIGKTVSVDFKRQSPMSEARTEVQAQVEILTPEVPSESLRLSVEVFNNDSGATTVCMGAAAP
jgi:hypothetical protein